MNKYWYFTALVQVASHAQLLSNFVVAEGPSSQFPLWKAMSKIATQEEYKGLSISIIVINQIEIDVADYLMYNAPT
jgi:hypothetical protein